jgi:hypothetical protein
MCHSVIAFYQDEYLNLGNEDTDDDGIGEAFVASASGLSEREQKEATLDRNLSRSYDPPYNTASKAGATKT